jgi:hypothetical protein
MKFDKEKSCFVNDDGSKLKPTKSLIHYTNTQYVRWCMDGLRDSDKPVVNNSGLWDYVHGRHDNAGTRDWK